MNSINNKNYIDYKTYNKKNILIKDLISKKLKVEQLNIKTFNDIAYYAELFTKYVPYSNIELIGGNFDYDIDFLVNCIENKGGRCLHLNIIWGLLLTEFGFDIKLIKSIEDTPNKIYSIFEYHYANVLKWNDGKYYLFDIGLGFLNCYYPIEIGNEVAIKGYSKLLPECLYRVVQNKNILNDSTFILQKKLINQYNENLNDNCFKPIFEFSYNINHNIDDNQFQVTNELINERCKRYIKTKYKLPATSILSIHNDGYYFYVNDSFTIISPYNQRYISKIENKDQLELLLLKYFNINIYNSKYFNDNIKNNKYIFNNNETTRSFLSSK